MWSKVSLLSRKQEIWIVSFPQFRPLWLSWKGWVWMEYSAMQKILRNAPLSWITLTWSWYIALRWIIVCSLPMRHVYQAVTSLTSCLRGERETLFRSVRKSCGHQCASTLSRDAFKILNSRIHINNDRIAFSLCPSLSSLRSPILSTLLHPHLPQLPKRFNSHAHFSPTLFQVATRWESLSFFFQFSTLLSLFSRQCWRHHAFSLFSPPFSLSLTVDAY